MKIVPVILSGGAGTRLWPVSRELHPKPFIRLADGKSLLQKAFLRAAILNGVEEIITVTNRELFFKTKDEYSEVNQQGKSLGFILEPMGRNTAPAIAAAAAHVAKRFDAETILLVLTADHLISDQEAFAKAVETAATLASEGHVVTFGIQPETPETGYGYIEAEGHKVLRFVEKPTLDKAQEYLESGRFLWNSGMFCLTADTALAELTQHAPEVLSAVENCLAVSRTLQSEDLVQVELDAAAFKQAPDISIDYALMERTGRAAVVPCSIGWSDIGSWNAIGELIPSDLQNNRVEGEALMHDTQNCFIQSRERIVGTVGVSDLVIIDTPDALLVANKERVQDVKHIVGQLKSIGHEAYKLHRTVHRPWGTYTVLEEGNGFKIKRIEVKPGASLSLQMHHHRSEHWVVVCGTAKVTNGDREMIINSNESTYIPAGCKHRLENPGAFDLVMIEVQSGAYVGEDDIVRFEDCYGRVTS